MSQKELFDAFLRLKHCRKCRRRLHTDTQRRYATRPAGLCYRCLRQFNAAATWQVDLFVSQEERK